MKCFKIILIILLASACTSSPGDSVKGGNLTVYYTTNTDQRIAEKIAIFWKENDLISNQKQDLQLVNRNNVYYLRLIAIDPKKVKSIPFAERKLLFELQKDLQETVFEQGRVELVICNEKFEPIYNINS